MFSHLSLGIYVTYGSSWYFESIKRSLAFEWWFNERNVHSESNFFEHIDHMAKTYFARYNVELKTLAIDIKK
jgi:hypothetical protein